MDGLLLKLPVYRVIYSYIKQCPPAFSLYFVTTKRVWPSFLCLFAQLKFRLQSKGFWSLLRSHWAKTTIWGSEMPLDLIVMSQVITRFDNGHWRQPYNFIQVFSYTELTCLTFAMECLIPWYIIIHLFCSVGSAEKAFVWILFWYFKVQ